MDKYKNIADKVKKLKKMKILLATGGALPVILPALGILVAIVVVVAIVASVSELLPVFNVVTMVGDETTYAKVKEELPSEWTIDGIDTWSTEEKAYFNDFSKENTYFNDDFKNYNAKKIMKNTDDELDLSIVAATVQYQGIIGLTSLGNEYEGETYSDGTVSTDYNGEALVDDSHSRNFYVQASEMLGNTFMIYPGMRMLLGNLVENNVTFRVVTCEPAECDTSTFSTWSLLGKIISSNENDAAQGYSVSGALEQMTKAITYGESACVNETDDWKRENICYDTDLLFEEIFGSRFSLSETTIKEYLEETYSSEDSKARVPVASLIVNGYFPAGDYIDVSVEKEIDYDLYSKYLKEVYIPYLYVNCDDCGYKNESDELKEAKAESVYNEIMEFTNAFKYYNDEDYIDGYGEASDIGGGGTHSVDYSCSSNSAPNIVSYKGHKGLDLNGVPIGTQIYPLFEGTVVATSSCDKNYKPEGNDSSGYTCNNANNHNCGYGNMIKIRGTAADGREYYAIYGHLSRIDVSVGDKVEMNTVIGLLGNTGCSTGAHLHLELRKTSDYSVVYANSIYTSEAIKSVLCSR